MGSTLDLALARRVLPVIVLDDAGAARPLADALLAGGLPCAEITLRTPEALRAIESLAARDDGFIVGAGTVLSASDVADAVSAGAQFLLSPALDDKLLETAAEAGVPLIPGVASATEVLRCIRQGVNLVKLFPAAALGGPALVAALAAVFPRVRFIPTGGIDAAAAGSYLALPSVAAVGGSWMASQHLIANSRYAEITALTSDAVRAAAGGR
ncbi:bifunctional 4-hydroxy-2-oxoglutarate aldolase/2-dehydro-3-deoxy-phosphogluconate aldolase [uncultured Jatrophihabitans sp.]|uniref:bifunctional 4-hydroxy-2-oxoglutarate aldolase/2-dehydro-3-deoxy-phosphogluconate aldolase n=1 Tax=uncultured Jatrophihabitans sp. TaxID=1610747 RepID=UPI0035C99B4C